MIIESLALTNVGTFSGRHDINLRPSDPQKPIVLIGGLNGAGKTTVLESIQLALYGSLLHATGRRGGSYENYLRGLIHRGSPPRAGAAVELVFSSHQEGVERLYRIRRSWRPTGASLQEELLVAVDGQHDDALTSTWSEYVETFLPRGIAGLFFFDGEQIEALADLERSQQVLGSALSSLLGLDLVDRLSTDLAVLRRRHQGRKMSDELRQQVDDKRELVTRQRQAEETAAAMEAARRNDVERAEKLVHAASERYRSVGGELFEQREHAENRSTNTRSELANVEDELRHELSESSPLLLIEPLLQDMQEQVHREVAFRRDALVIEALDERDQALIGELTALNASKRLLAAAAGYLAADRSRRLSSVEIDVIIGMSSSADLDRLTALELPGARMRLRELSQRRIELRREIEQLDRVLVAMPDSETLAPIITARETARHELARAEGALDVTSEQLRLTRAERLKAQAQYEASLDKAAHINLSADDDRRLLEHAERVRVTLERLRLASAEKNMTRIATLILEALGLLLRKQRLVTDVQIDPSTFTISLTGSDQRPLPATDLSAGERQLLAVALLWGLARAAGRPLPVVIDTPLGRLDGMHRTHLLTRYFPHASHQVILLSTDTEIDTEAYELIRPYVGRAMALQFDPTTNSTSVAEGYFGGIS